MIYEQKIIVTTSIAAANEQKSGIAGLRRRYPASNPLPYCIQIIIRAVYIPPEGRAPKQNESKQEIDVIHTISDGAILRFE